MDSPRLCAEILLTHVIGGERLKLYTDPDRPAADAELAKLRELAGRALRHEPVQYLVGEGWFYGLPMAVDRRVLIPRPCTERIVERVAQHLRPRRDEGEGDAAAGGGALVADVCTGSGCIAVAIARQVAGCRVIGCDVSGEALEVAAANAGRHGVAERVEFRPGDLLTPLAGEAGNFDAVVANPPYIPDHEWEAVAPNVRDFEPVGALRAGPDGLRLVRPLIEGAAALLKPGGLVMVEIAACTADEALGLARSHCGLVDAAIERDLEGHQRFVVARRGPAVGR